MRICNNKNKITDNNKDIKDNIYINKLIIVNNMVEERLLR